MPVNRVQGLLIHLPARNVSLNKDRQPQHYVLYGSLTHKRNLDKHWSRKKEFLSTQLDHFKSRDFAISLKGLLIGLKKGEAELGIRPEDIEILRGDSGVSARVEMTSLQGSENIVQARIGEEQITVRASKEEKHEQGTDIFLKMNPGRIHIFRKGLRQPFLSRLKSGFAGQRLPGQRAGGQTDGT